MYGNPSVQELSPQTLRDAFEDVFNDVQLMTSTNSTGFAASISTSFTLDADTWLGYLPEIYAGSVLAFEYKKTGDSNLEEYYWTILKITEPENWDYASGNLEPAIMFLNNEGETQVKVNFDPTGYEFRVFYFGYEEETDGEVNLPTFFEPLFKFGIASSVTPTPALDNEQLKAIINANAEMWATKFLYYKDQLDKWLRTSRAKRGIGQRTPSNVARRYGRRVGFDWGGTN